MSERFERGPDIYHMECDICGKKEDIVNKDPYEEKWLCRKHWTRLDYEYAAKNPWGESKRTRRGLTFCPECTKKFKKLLKNVNFEEE